MNNFTTNSSRNYTIPFSYQNTQQSPIYFSIWSSATLFSTISLFTIILSKSKLIPTEFAILIVFNITTLVLKLCLTLVYLSEWQNMFGLCFYSINSSITYFVFPMISSTLFYYSLYQVSNISRSRLFIILFNQTRSLKKFLIFEIFIFLIFASASISIYVINSEQDPFCTNQNIAKYFYLIIFAMFVPALFPLVVYAFGIAYICVTRLRNQKQKYSTNNETQTSQNRKRFKMNLNLMLKFLFLALIYIFGALPQTANYFIYINCPKCSANLKFISYIIYVSNFFYIFQPIFLIYIHAILQKRFLQFICYWK